MIVRKRTLAAYLLPALLIGVMAGCGGAAKQTNTSTTNGGTNNNGGNGSESQPSR